LRAWIGDQTVTFSNVEAFETYFPMVSRDDNDAIYGVVTTLFSPANLSIWKEIPVVEQLPTATDISKLFTKPTPKDWNSLSYEQLFHDGFPYAPT